MTQFFRMPARGADAEDAGVRMPGFSDGWALFLDVDGTLLELAEHPLAVHVEPALIQQLSRLQSLAGGAVALVSGRSIAELDRLFVPLHLAIAGQHGAELRHADGKTEVDRPRIAAVATARGALAALASQNHGLYFEDKGAALAVHYRRVPQLGPLVERTLQDVARRSGGEFAMQTGKMVRELVPHGKNKGGAIAEFMREPPFAGRIPVFLGDDMTDEDGFALVGKIAGHAIKVGPGESIAPHRIADVRGVRRWLWEYADWLETRGN
jgi:trehalose 6-phosphate phosphatase